MMKMMAMFVEVVAKMKLDSLHFNYKLIIGELQRRKIKVSFVGNSQYIKAVHKDHVRKV
jgi:hypothetical protein